MRIKRIYQIVKHHVGHVFMKDSLVPKRPDIQFEGLTLYNSLVGNVLDTDRGKIRLSGHRTDCRKFVRFELYDVAAVGMAVRERFKFALRLRLALSKQGQPLQFILLSHAVFLLESDTLWIITWA